LGFGDVGDDSIDEVSGDVKGVEMSCGDLEELSDSLPELEDRLLVVG
jgi:hypothetical protein